MAEKDILLRYDIHVHILGYVVSPFKSIIMDQPQQQRYNNNAINCTLEWLVG